MVIPQYLRAGKEASLGRLLLLLLMAAPGPVARLARLEHAADAFAPRMDFEQWRPLTGRGDPLRNDPTYDYEPPVLERVHYWAHRPRPDSKSEVLVLGVSSRRPSAGPPRPPPPPPPPSRRFPDTLLQPPPPPPPALAPAPAPAAATRHTAPSYSLQEADLVYHSSTLDAVSGDYAGWGPTTPLDADDDAQNLIPGGASHVREPSYVFYAPMTSETPTAAAATRAAETEPEPTTTTATATEDTTTEERTEPARSTDVVVTETQRQEITTRPSAVARPLHMIGPMMSMPLGRPDVTLESQPARPTLIIQGHSKVKTYGSRPEPARHRNAIGDDDAPKAAESQQVKHLHARTPDSHRASDRAPARLASAKSLRAIVASGVGGADWQEADLGVEYDVSDGSGVPLEAYRRGIVESELRRGPASRLPTRGLATPRDR